MEMVGKWWIERVVDKRVGGCRWSGWVSGRLRG